MGPTASSAKEMASGAMRMSKRIFLSYVIDWVLIILIAGIGGIFNKAVNNTNKRPFSLQDPSITYPYQDDTVTVAVLLIVVLVAPAVITAVISLIFVPGPTASKSTPKALIWRRKIWEWNTAWMGLALSLATAFMTTEGLKDLAGKPRPYALDRCRPDLENIDQYRLGGLGQSFSTTGAVPILVSSDICQERDPQILREIFASWPSGHSSFSFAGLLYLTLFLCAKFSVGIPYLLPNQNSATSNTYDYDTYLRKPQSPSNQSQLASYDTSSSQTQHESGVFATPPPRNTTAAAPIYLLILAVFVPIGTAFFICVSRWFDFHHHGIDIFTGAVIGAFTAWFSFRFYHMPIRRGSGWAWGARSRGRAFWVGVGRDGYVGEEGWMAAKAAKKASADVEAGGKPAVGNHAASAGLEDHGDLDGPSRLNAHGAQSEGGYVIRNAH